MTQYDRQLIIDRAFGGKPIPKNSRLAVERLLDHLDGKIIVLPVRSPDETFRAGIRSALLQEAYETYGIREDEILSPTRRSDVVKARMMVHYVFQQLTGATERETSEAYGMSRKRISFHAMKKKMEDLQSVYPEFRDEVRRFRNRTLMKYNASRPESHA